MFRKQGTKSKNLQRIKKQTPPIKINTKSLDRYEDTKLPEFSLASMKRLIRRVGKDRVSKDASLELSTVLESLGKNIAEEAIRKAEQEGVKTINKKHIKAAVEEVKK